MSSQSIIPDSSQRASGMAGESYNRQHHTLSLGLLLLMLVSFSRVSRYTRTSLLTLAPGGGPEGLKTWNVERLRSWDIDPSKLLLGLVFCIFLATMLLRPRSRLVRLDLPLKLLMVFNGYALVASAWAYAPSFSFIQAARFLQYIVVYLLIIALTSTRDDLNHWGHLFLYTPFANLAGIIQEVLGSSAEALAKATGGRQLTWWAVYPTWAVLFLPFSLHYLLWSRNRTETTLAALALLANLATVVLSFRRTGPLAVGAVMLAYFLLVGRRHRAFVPMVGIIVLGAVLTLKLDPHYAQRLGTIPWVGGASIEDWRGGDRLMQYAVGLQIFLAHPVGGIGLNGAHLWIKEVYGYHRYLGQHNTFLKLASELGLVGLGIYSVFLVSAMKRSLGAVSQRLSVGDSRGASLSAAPLCSLIGVLFWANFHDRLFGLRIYLCAALGSASYRILVDRDSSGQNP